MKNGGICLAALVAAGLIAGQEPPTLPPLPARDELAARPWEQQLADREVVKRVVVERMIRLKEAATRLTPENAAACYELAVRQKAPAVFTELLCMEASGEWHGRDLRELRLSFDRLVAQYGVDALGIRLCLYGLPYSTQEMRRALEWLPLEHAFNLNTAPEPTGAELRSMLKELAGIYGSVSALYETVNSRETADAAAADMLRLMKPYEATLPARLLLAKLARPEDLSAYRELALPAAMQLHALRLKLMETDYYGSRKLALVDFLFN